MKGRKRYSIKKASKIFRHNHETKITKPQAWLFLFRKRTEFSNSNAEGDGNKWIFKGELSASKTYTLTIDDNNVKDKYKAYTAKYAIEKVV